MWSSNIYTHWNSSHHTCKSVHDVPYECGGKIGNHICSYIIYICILYNINDVEILMSWRAGHTVAHQHRAAMPLGTANTYEDGSVRQQCAPNSITSSVFGYHVPLNNSKAGHTSGLSQFRFRC